MRRERQGAWVTELGLSIHTDVRRSQGHVASMMGARQVHDGCVDISTNTWRAMEWPVWDVFLG